VLTADRLRAALIDGIPLHRLLGMDTVEGPDRTAVRLPDLPQTRNHLGGQAGAALFAVAEAASAAAVFNAFGEDLVSLFAVPSGASIRFLRPARGGVTAHAALSADPAGIVARVSAGDALMLPVEVTIADDTGGVVAEAETTWHFAPVRPGAPSALPG
jgi:acyl-coenzyme A thioesterase PaaI-like protein